METGIEKLSLSTFDPIKERFIKLTSEETFLKEASFALQLFQKNPYLAQMDKGSILTAILNVSQLNLTLNPMLKYAYLVPRKNQCCLEVGYQGLVKLVTDTGSSTSIYAHCVYSKDDFSYELGLTPNIVHKPFIGDRGKVIAAYSVSVLHNNSKQVEVMGIDELESIRNDSDSYKAFKNGKAKSCIWEDYFDEMCRKTVIKRSIKYLPKTDQYSRLAKAVEILDEDWAISYEQADYIDNLLLKATIPEERKEQIVRTMNLMKKHEANSLIEELKLKQVDPIQSQGYNMGDIQNKLKEIK
jgi:phage RecT family recombinase